MGFAMKILCFKHGWEFMIRHGLLIFGYFNLFRGNSSFKNIFPIRKANAQQPHSPGGADDIERWCGLSS